MIMGAGKGLGWDRFLVFAAARLSPAPRGGRSFIVPLALPLLDADFLVRKVACGILRPFVAVVGFRAGAEIAAADVEEAAFGAAPLDMGLLVLELVQELDFRVVPDLREGPFQHVAEDMLPPELVCADIAVPGDAADAAAGAVAFVELEKLENFFGALPEKISVKARVVLSSSLTCCIPYSPLTCGQKTMPQFVLSSESW